MLAASSCFCLHSALAAHPRSRPRPITQGVKSKQATYITVRFVLGTLVASGSGVSCGVLSSSFAFELLLEIGNFGLQTSHLVAVAVQRPLTVLTLNVLHHVGDLQTNQVRPQAPSSRKRQLTVLSGFSRTLSNISGSRTWFTYCMSQALLFSRASDPNIFPLNY